MRTIHRLIAAATIPNRAFSKSSNPRRVWYKCDHRQIYEYQSAADEPMKSITSVFLFVGCIFCLPDFSPPFHGVNLGPRLETPSQISVLPHTIPSEPVGRGEAGVLSDAISLQDQKPVRLYVVRVVDATSKDPIVRAKIWVEIGELPDQRNGYTDARGAFTFTWHLTKARIKTHISVEADGYPVIEDFGVLTEERLIQLSKSK